LSRRPSVSPQESRREEAGSEEISREEEVTQLFNQKKPSP
jgi:hypothetical protein